MGTMLVAEDDADVRLLLEMTLAGDDRRLLFAEDGRTALALCRSERPDVVVLDHRMPGLDGLAVAAALRADGLAGEVVLFTAHPAGHVDDDAARLGLRTVRKGDLDALVALVDRLLADPTGGARAASGGPQSS